MSRPAGEYERPESFIRWQAITIAQLTVAINVILGLAGASLAFAANLLIINKDSSQLAGWAGWTVLISFVPLLISMGFGVWCTINRLRDFRTTQNVARLRETNRSAAEIEPLRVRYRKLTRRTWRLFYWQIGTFLAGFVLMVAGIGGSLWTKLGCTPLD